MTAEILKVIQEMRDRKVNHGQDTSPTLEAWADRLESALSQQAEPAPAQDEREASHAPAWYGAAEAEAWSAAMKYRAAPIAQTASQQVALCEDEGCPHHGTEHVCRSVPPLKPRRALLELAQQHGAILTGKPDGSEPISMVFSIAAWRAFDAALQEQEKAV